MRNGNTTPPAEWNIERLTEARHVARGPFTVYETGEDGDVEVALYADPAQVVARCGSWEQARALVDALTFARRAGPLLAQFEQLATTESADLGFHFKMVAARVELLRDTRAALAAEEGR